MNFKGKVAIVTGASRGIGQEIATQLAANGAAVACVATRLENALQTSEIICKNGGTAAAFGCDVSDADQVNNLIKEVEETLGPPAILVNNAGLTRDGLMIRMRDEDWDRVINVNLKGAYLMIKAVSRSMMKARYGRIVNVSSIVGLHGAAGQVNYAASKAGLIGLTMSVAKELGSRGITCNAIAPGFIETDMTNELSAEMREHVRQTAPLGRLGLPTDIAPAVIFLCSDQAGYVTGQTLTVDGGLSL